jgi:hypothetical protein
MAYLIGQLGTWLPVPGGIDGVELGLVGALVLYGLLALTATAAVLLYRVIELWIPAVLGSAAFVQLRLLLRRETEESSRRSPPHLFAAEAVTRERNCLRRNRATRFAALGPRKRRTCASGARSPSAQERSLTN